jgi:glucose dehydrogenase
MSEPSPPRVLGLLLSLLGAALLIGGISIPATEGGYYFMTVGAGIVVSGILIALGKLAGAYVYGLTVAVMVVWSLLELGADFGQLLPRIVLPIAIAAYVFSPNVRARLT